MGALLKRPSLAICSPNPSAAHRWAAHALSGHQGTHSRLCPPVLWGHSPLSSGTGIGSVSQSRPLWTYELSPCCLLSPGLWRAASPSPTGCEGPGVPGLRAAPPRGVLVSEAPPCPWQFEIRAEHIALGVYQPPKNIPSAVPSGQRFLRRAVFRVPQHRPISMHVACPALMGNRTPARSLQPLPHSQHQARVTNIQESHGGTPAWGTPQGDEHAVKEG